jgi:hypothetical protein
MSYDEALSRSRRIIVYLLLLRLWLWLPTVIITLIKDREESRTRVTVIMSSGKTRQKLGYSNEWERRLRDKLIYSSCHLCDSCHHVFITSHRDKRECHLSGKKIIIYELMTKRRHHLRGRLKCRRHHPLEDEGERELQNYEWRSQEMGFRGGILTSLFFITREI